MQPGPGFALVYLDSSRYVSVHDCTIFMHLAAIFIFNNVMKLVILTIFKLEGAIVYTQCDYICSNLASELISLLTQENVRKTILLQV